jgi:hypothetical protein
MMSLGNYNPGISGVGDKKIRPFDRIIRGHGERRQRNRVVTSKGLKKLGT